MIIDYSSLIQAAFEARENSVCSYSGFAVGAALLCESGEVFVGCNVECGAYPATICAERAAISSAISNGEKNFAAIAVVGGNTEQTEFDFCPPCGLCRQVIAELCTFCDFQIILAKSPEEYEIYTVEQLLPLAFSGKML